MRTGERRPQCGFSYFGVLFLVALMGAVLAAAGQLWSTAAQRERERELLWVGSQYAQALRSYYRSSPGQALYPEQLEDLLEDRRFPQVQRHLRKRYADPLSGSPEWGLIRSIDGRIAGVYSLAQGTPFKRERFPEQWSDFAGTAQYSDWRFVAERAFLGAGGSHVPAP